MSPFRYRDEDESLGTSLAGLAVGALAGFAVGMVVAQKVGGLAGLRERLRERFGGGQLLEEGDEEETELEGAEGEYDEAEGEEGEEGEEEFDELEDEAEDEDGFSALEERVLEAFRNDPILCERAVDIGAVGEGIIELTGWVHEESEAQHAVTLTRGVPGVDTVVNRLTVGEVGEEEDEMADEETREFDDNENTPLSGGRWEGNRVGTGRRRQGTSSEADRHADPKTELEERWLAEQHQIEAAAGDIEGVAERRRQAKNASIPGDRTGGSPVAPTGVPKADHVADPESAPDSQRNL